MQEQTVELTLEQTQEHMLEQMEGDKEEQTGQQDTLAVVPWTPLLKSTMLSLQEGRVE